MLPGMAMTGLFQGDCPLPLDTFGLKIDLLSESIDSLWNALT